MFLRSGSRLSWVLAFFVLRAIPSAVHGTLPCEQAGSPPPLLATENDQWAAFLPADALLLEQPAVIERFLEALDGSPPDWSTVYGTNGEGHDERLFALNRERDQARAGKAELGQRITFLWPGELSRYSEEQGFRVAIGPKVIPTRWGDVRFKPDLLCSDLVIRPNPELADVLRARRARGERIEVVVVMTGRLVREESIIYDFAHEEPGRGMVMPVVQIERVDYLLVP